MFHLNKPYNILTAKYLIKKEHELIIKVRGHPNIIRSAGYKTEGTICSNIKINPIMYNVLEHAENGSISKFIRQTGPIEEDVARLFAAQI